jgi:GT2 family glycosyltransferase
MYCPDSKVYHVGGGTLPKNNSRKTYLNFRNNFYLLYKNLPSERLLKVFTLRLLLDFVAGLKFLSEGGFKDLGAVVKAHFSFYLSLRQNYKKRKNINQKNVSNIYNSNIVWEHYVRKKQLFSQLKTELFTK